MKYNFSLATPLHPLLLTMNGLQDSVEFLSEKYDNVYKKVEELDKKVSDVHSENKCLKAELLRMSAIVERQNNELNEIEQYSRRNCFEISAFSEEKDEDLNMLVVRIGSLMNVEFRAGLTNMAEVAYAPRFWAF